MIAFLNASVKAQHPWIKRFEARSKGVLGHYSIHMIASDHTIDNDYTTGSKGSVLAKQKGYPDPPKQDYHWAEVNGEAILKRNPNKADELIELQYNPRTGEFSPTISPPPDYKWHQQDGTFIAKSQGKGTLEYDVQKDQFTYTGGQKKGEPYQPPGKGGANWIKHQYGNPKIKPCFPTGTLVKTPNGDKYIESLKIGDIVFAYDFESHKVVKRPIIKVHQNWTEYLVETQINSETITSTRQHQFWIENSKWLSAENLQPGMKLFNLNCHNNLIENVKIEPKTSITYNFEVLENHNYFVGSIGILVHNGDGNASAFEDQTKKKAKIYEIVKIDPQTNQEKIVYRGKTTQESVNDRFKEHLRETSDPRKANWKQLNEDRLLFVREIDDGNWTNYETAVWEQHYIDDALDKGYPLVNDLSTPPISQKSYNQYKPLHQPCL